MIEPPAGSESTTNTYLCSSLLAGSDLSENTSYLENQGEAVRGSTPVISENGMTPVVAPGFSIASIWLSKSAGFVPCTTTSLIFK